MDKNEQIKLEKQNLNKKEYINELEINKDINIKEEEYTKIMFIYNAALKEFNSKIETLKEQYKYFNEEEPIEYIKTRIKSPKSIINKMKKKKYELTYENMLRNISDIAGIRIICNFKDDVYKIMEDIQSFSNIKIVSKKDYIKNPKPSGYMSYHLIIEVPIEIQRKTVYVKIEVQIRTLAMDFWSTIEHKVKYKNTINNKNESKKLVEYAKAINKIDNKMLDIAKSNSY